LVRHVFSNQYPEPVATVMTRSMRTRLGMRPSS
jgi:hypothetical protein